MVGPRLRRFLRRGIPIAGVILVGSAIFDVFNYNVLSRSLRTVYGGVKLAYAYKFTDPQTIEEIDALHQYAADLILNICLTNEGLYIKMGQGLSSMSHVLPPEYTTTLRVLLDQAPPVTIGDVKEVFTESTGAGEWSDVFESFDEVAVASASIAQVHKARVRNPDGSIVNVAVKVQKPKIKHQIWWDLQCYFLLCHTLQFLFDIPMRWSAQTIAENLLREVDFTLELANCERARQQLPGHPNIYIPKTYPHLSSKRLMVTEWVDAVKLNNVEAVKAEFDVSTVLTHVFNYFGDMVFRDGFVHCDPHPANLMARWKKDSNGQENRKEVEIVVLDFGLCISETESFRLGYALLFKAMFTHDTQLLKDVVESWGINNPELFAAMTIQKPYSSSKPLHTANVTHKELLAMQMQMKDHVRSLLAKEELVPTEIVFVGRCLNLLRAVNKLYGAPINRINLFARRAVMGLGPVEHIRDIPAYLEALRSSNGGAAYAAQRRREWNLSSTVNRWRFEWSLLMLSLVHNALWYYSRVAALLGLRGSSLEDIAERAEAEAITGGRNPAARKRPHVHGVMRIEAND